MGQPGSREREVQVPDPRLAGVERDFFFKRGSSLREDWAQRHNVSCSTLARSLWLADLYCEPRSL